MHLASLHLYPVKSCRGLSVRAVELDELGLVGDRRFMLVDETNLFMTQRIHPRMAQIATQLSAGRLSLTADSAGSVSVPIAPDPAAPLRPVSVWKSAELLAEDCGADAAGWLSEFLGLRCRLVRIGARFSRPVLKAAGQPGDQVAFNDAVPVLVVGTASLADLNDRIRENQGSPVPMDRFRPNLVVDGGEAFAEDLWPRVRIGAVCLRNAGPCARCPVTTTDQLTGERGKEPLKTLALFRRDPAEPARINFGSNYIHETKSGVLRVGDEVVPA